jgi:Domain of unknown function (DU1801)
MRLDATTIEEYFAAAGDREPDLRDVDEVIRSTAPDLVRQLFVGPSITMIGYGEMSWERPSGSGVWPLIGMALQKQYISLYVAAVKDGQTLAGYYDERLGRTANGKHCIRFRRVADIDVAELANAVRDAVSWAEVQEERFGRNCAAPIDSGAAPKT